MRVSNSGLTSLDVSNNTALTYLGVDYDVDYFYYSAIYYYEYSGTPVKHLTNIDISKNTALEELYIFNVPLTTLDVSNNTKLTSLEVINSALTTLDVSMNTALTYLDVRYDEDYAYYEYEYCSFLNFPSSKNKLTSLDVNGATALTSLDVSNNQLTNLDVSKNTALTYLDVSNNQLTTLDVSKNAALTRLYVSSNQLTTLDASKNTALTNLSVGSNQLTSLDVSKNTELEKLDVSNTPLAEHYVYGFVGDNITLTKPLIYPESWYSAWKSSNGQSVTINKENIHLVNTGYSKVINEIGSNSRYMPTITYHVYVFGLKSDKYVVDNNGNKIYITSNITADEILKNISIDYSEAPEEKQIYTLGVANNNIVIKDNNKIVKEYDLVRLEVTSDSYIINNDEIKYMDEFNIDNIKINYGIKKVSGNKLIIKNGDKVIKEYNLVKLNINIESNKYNVIDDNILYFNTFDDNNITDNCPECSKNVVDNKLVIKYKDNVLKSYKLLKIKSEYRVGKDTIFTKGDLKYDDFLSCRNSCSSDKDQVTCADKCDEEYENAVNTILTKITSSDVDLSVNKDKLVVKYESKIIKEFTLSNVDESFDISDYKVDDNKNIITGIGLNTKIDSFKSKIDTNVEYEITDISGNVMTNEIIKTGYKLKLAFSVEPMEYVLSIKGDVLGEGTITKDGGKLIAKHIIDGNVIKGDAYLDAADYNSDGLIKMNDVIRMLKENNK